MISPPGWTATVNPNEVISWRPTSGPAFLGQPAVTFAVQSSYTDAIAYDQVSGLYERGMVIGVAYTLPDHHAVAGGYERFSFLGPEVPEPSSFVLVVFAALLGSRARRSLHPEKPC